MRALVKIKFLRALLVFFLFAAGPVSFSLEAQEPKSSLPKPQNKISLDAKGMEISELLKMIATRAGLNIVVGTKISGKATLFLKDVDAWDAFEVVLLANGLAYEKKGNIINVISQKDYESIYGKQYQDNRQARVVQLKYARVADLSPALNEVKSKIGKIVIDAGSNTLFLIDTPDRLKEMQAFIKNTDLPIETRVFDLNYAQADKISPKIQEALTKGIGSIKIDERTNKIAVRDYTERLEEIAKIIAAFDEKTPQVLIDAQIIQLTPSDLFEMGVNWDYWIKKYFEFRAALPVGTANRLLLGTVSYPSSVEQNQYKAIIDILRTIGDTKVLSSPRVMALNNQEARIHVGKREAYITSTVSQGSTGTTVTAQAVNFVDTGIELYVTPIISREGFITMKIRPEISDATMTDITSEGKISQIPIVTTSEAETTVMVKDGITIIIGGLTKDKKEKTVKKIPILGDMPLLGFFFRSTSENLTKTELVILLTPHLISGENSISDFSELKPREGVVARMLEGEIIKEKVSLSRQQRSLGSLSGSEQALVHYCQALIDRINQFARKELPQGKTGKVSINFNVSGDGNLIGEPMADTAEPALIPAAIKAVKAAAPFSPFPRELDKKEENFRVTLEYK